MAGIRRKAREVSIQALFEVDTVGHDPDATVRRLLSEKNLNGDAASFAVELVDGVIKNKEKIDAIIKESAPEWDIEQMATVDRNILRLAIFEILFNNKVPLKAAINEAIELAKTFGGEKSAKFVNGVLGAVSRKWRSEG